MAKDIKVKNKGVVGIAQEKNHFVFNNDLTMESLVKFLNLVDFCPTSEDKAEMMRGLKGIEIKKF